MPVDPTQADAVFAAIERKYGEGRVHTGADAQQVDRVSLGSYELDYCTGGGLPLGRFSRFYGGYSSGKSLMAWNAIRSAQERGLKCVYYNVEKQYDPKYVAKLGIDIEDLIVFESDTIEEIGEALEAMMGVAHLHVIDSTTHAASTDEYAAEATDWHRALDARAWSKSMKRGHHQFDTSANAVLLISQVRASMSYGGGEDVPGGKFLEHISSLTVHFHKGKYLYRNDHGFLSVDRPASKNNEPIDPDGFEITAKVVKSRVHRPLMNARMRYDFDTRRLDLTYELTKALTSRRFGPIAKKSGSWYELPSGNKVQGEAGLRRAVEEDGELREMLVTNLIGSATLPR